MGSIPLEGGDDHAQPERDEPGVSPLALPAVVLLLAASGTILWLVGGPPRPPVRPDPGGVLAVLRGTAIPADAVASWLLAAGWALWGWIALSVLAQGALAALASLTRGARWVRAIRIPVDRLSAPFTRRLFPVVTAGLIVAQLAARPGPRAAAAPAPAPIVATLQGAGTLGVPAASLAVPGDAGPRATVEHLVVEGDTLLTLAARYYGTEEEYARLLRANEGRLLGDGSPFVGVLVPGETVLVPPASATAVTIGDETIYTVEEGDTLRGIAARFLGDEMRWPEIFAENEGRAGLADGRTLTDPDLIWPGLELVIPAPPVAPPPPSPSPPPAAPATPPPSPAPSAASAAPATATPSATPTPAPSSAPSSPAPSPFGTAAVSTASPTAVPASPTPIRATPAWPGAAGTATWTGTATSIPGIGPHTPRAAPTIGGGGTIIGLGLGAAAFAGAAFLAAREARRRLRVEPAALTPVAGGFAEPDLARDFAHRRHGVTADPAAIVAATVARTLAEEGLRDVTILAAHHGRGRATLILDAYSDDRERVGALAPALGARLGGRCEVATAASGDLILRLSGLGPLDRLSPALDGGPTLLPLGVLGNREAFFGNWSALGQVLVVDLPGGGGETILAGLVAAIAAALPPERLRLRLVARRRALPEELGALPHLAGEPIDPDDGPALASTLAELREELFRRLRDGEAGAAPARPEIVLVATELADLRGAAGADTTLDLLAREGPPRGIRFLAATTCPDALDDALLAHFATRLVLRLLDEEQSLRLLGLTDATELGEGGWLILRLAGRRPWQPDGWSPLTLRGVRVPPDGLAALVQQLLAAWGGTAPVATDAPSEDPAALAPAAVPGRGAREGGDAEPARPAGPGQTSADRGGDVGRPGAPTAGDAGLDGAAGIGAQGDGSAGRAATRAVPDSAPAGARGGPLVPHPFPPGRADARGESGEDAARAENALPRALPAIGGAGRPAPPIAVRCFGHFEVRHGERLLDPAAGERSTYKAWELLAFLAVSPPGPHARDTLLARVWPDLPLNPRRPANALNMAVSRLRKALTAQVPGLPPDIVRPGRDGTYRLNTALVASDAHRFLALADAWKGVPLEDAVAMHEEAFALHRKELLSGSGYAWLDDPPEGAKKLPALYGAVARDFTLGLARRCAREGRADLAAPLYRRLLDDEPTREDYARELYRVYGALGDRRALVRADRALRRALRDDPNSDDAPDGDPELYEPEEATRETFRQVLAELDLPIQGERDTVHGRRAG